MAGIGRGRASILEPLSLNNGLRSRPAVRFFLVGFKPLSQRQHGLMDSCTGPAANKGVNAPECLGRIPTVMVGLPASGGFPLAQSLSCWNGFGHGVRRCKRSTRFKESVLGLWRLFWRGRQCGSVAPVFHPARRARERRTPALCGAVARRVWTRRLESRRHDPWVVKTRGPGSNRMRARPIALYLDSPRSRRPLHSVPSSLRPSGPRGADHSSDPCEHSACGDRSVNLQWAGGKPCCDGMSRTRSGFPK